MAGGTFDKTGKVRPGTYINFSANKQDKLNSSSRGTVLLPLLGHSYGPAKEFISISNSSPDAAIQKLGYSIYDDNPCMLLIREALKNAIEVIVYIPSQGEKATGSADSLNATAKYGGSRGNNLRFSVTANPNGGFDVSVYLDTDLVAEYERLVTIAELVSKNCDWIDFTGEGDLTADSGVNLTGGSDGTATNADIADFLDASEKPSWNTMAFPVEASNSLFETVKSKIKYLREDVGKYRKAVVANYNADYEGIINVTNSVELSDGKELTATQVTAWVAGVDAGASNTTSNTYTTYEGAVDIVDPKTHPEAIEAIKNGEFFFTFSEEGEVVVEYDINSLVTYEYPKDESYRKNRVMRVFDTFAETIKLNFPPNKFDNNETGWDIMEGIGRSILSQFQEAGAIKNVDLDNDFVIDRGSSDGDETFITVGLEAMDSSEKIYFTINTR